MHPSIDPPRPSRPTGRTLAAVVLLIAVLCAPTSFSQTVDDFHPSVGGDARGIQQDENGRIVFLRPGLKRVLPDGTSDPLFTATTRDILGFTATQEDGRMVLVGAYTSFMGHTRHSLSRCAPDGRLDVDYNPGNYPSIYWNLSLQLDGKCLVGGGFTLIGGQTRPRLARLNEDGTLDEGLVAALPGQVNAMAVQPDGKVLVAVWNLAAPAYGTYNVIRCNPDGSTDPTFPVSVFEGAINRLYILSDGKILCLGAFTRVGGVARPYMARLLPDGSVDGTFAPNPDNEVNVVLEQSDGRILCGGLFTQIAGVSRPYLARLNADGSFDPTLAGGPNYRVSALWTQADGALLLSGGFINIQGVPRSGIGRMRDLGAATDRATRDATGVTWRREGVVPAILAARFQHSPDGVTWTTLGDGTKTTDGWRWSGAVPEGNAVRALGWLPTVNSSSGWMVRTEVETPPVLAGPDDLNTGHGGDGRLTLDAHGGRPFVYRWRKDGVDLADGGVVSGVATHSLLLSGVTRADAGAYDVVVSNSFACVTSRVATVSVADPHLASDLKDVGGVAGGVSALSLSVTGTNLSYQWRKDGVVLPGVAGDTLPFSPLLAEHTGTYDVVITGTHGAVTSRVASVEVLRADSTTPPASNAGITCAVPGPGGELLLGGTFTSVNGQPRRRIARLLSDGGLDPDFAPEIGATSSPDAATSIRAIASLPDGKILMGGSFTSVGGVPLTHLARLNVNGTLDTSFAATLNSTVLALAIQPDRRILVVGEFTTVNGVARNYLARLLPDGALDTTFNPAPDNSVIALALQPDGKILTLGTFTRMGGRDGWGIARLHADGTADPTFRGVASGPYLRGLALQSDGKILVYGGWMALHAVACDGIGRLMPDGLMDPEFQNGIISSATEVQTVLPQTDGRIWVGGSFTSLRGKTTHNLARLSPDGEVELAAAPGAILVGGGTTTVLALHLSPGGRLLVAGSFDRLCGSTVLNAGWLGLGLPGEDGLDRFPSAATWRLSGAAPEYMRVDFDHTHDGSVYTSLGPGQRGAGGWHFTGAIPGGGVLRARGHLPCGYGGRSQGVVDQFSGEPLPAVCPEGVELDAGKTLRLSALAVGTPPLAYQWRKNGIPLADAGPVSGATRQVLTITGVLHADAGGYDVVAVNGEGAVTGCVAVVEVHDPAFVVEPGPTATHVGGAFTLGATAHGTDLTFQWYRDGVALAGETNSVLTRAQAVIDDAGDYQLVVANAFGSVTSRVATVGVVRADPAFGPGVTPAAMALDAAGNILLGGAFTKVGSNTSVKYLARLSPAGVLQTSFAPNPNGECNTISVQADGRILFGGGFKFVENTPRSYLARVDAAGVLDATFNPAPNGTIQQVLSRLDGRILVAGNFSQIAGQARSLIARLHNDGTFDASFVPPALTGYISTMAVLPDGKIMLSGSLQSAGWSGERPVIRLLPDGAWDGTYQPDLLGPGNCLGLLPGGLLLVGGAYSPADALRRPGYVLLDEHGMVMPSTPLSSSSTVLSLATQADGAYYLAGGIYGSTSGAHPDFLVRFHPDGTVDRSFNASAAGSIWALVLQGNGALVVGGGYPSVGGVATASLFRLDPWLAAVEQISAVDTGVLWTRGGSAPEISEAMLEYKPGGSQWLPVGPGVRVSDGWSFPPVQTTNTPHRITAVHSGGQYSASTSIRHLTLSPPVIISQPSANRTVTIGYGGALQVLIGVEAEPLFYQWRRDGVSLVEESGITGVTTPELRIADGRKEHEGVYDLVIWNKLGVVTSRYTRVVVQDPFISVPPAGRVVLPGETVSWSAAAHGTDLSYQWRKNGTPIPGATTPDYSFTVQDAGDLGAYSLVVAGHYGNTTSNTANVRFPVYDISFTPDPGLGAHVDGLTLQPDRRILVWGSFTQMSGAPIARLARLYPSGAPDTAFAPSPDGDVEAVAVQPNGKLLVAGRFGNIGGASRARLARLEANGVLDPGFSPPFTSDPADYVTALSVQADGRIHWAGYVDGAWRVGRLLPDGTTDPAFSPIETGVGPDARIDSLTLEPSGHLLVGGPFTLIGGGSRNALARFTEEGTLESLPAGNPSNLTAVMARLPDGRLLTGGNSSNLERLLADGTKDPSFTRRTVTGGGLDALLVAESGDYFAGGGFNSRLLRVQGTSSFSYSVDGTVVSALALQEDGALVAAGDFTTVDSRARRAILRMPPEAVESRLEFSPDGVTWVRNGSLPVFWRTTLEHSTNGVVWLDAGSGVRTSGPWTWAGAFPTSGVFRARGFAACGRRGGSVAILETRHEFDADNDALPDWWETLHYGSVTGAVDAADTDGDGMGARAEFIAGTDPRDPGSRLLLAPAPPGAGNQVTITWPSVPGRTYKVYYADDLHSAWLDTLPDSLLTAVDGQTELSYTDSTLGAHPYRAYRIEVWPEP